MIKAKDEWTTVYGGPVTNYHSFIFPDRSDRRKEKIKKIFNIKVEYTEK